MMLLKDSKKLKYSFEGRLFTIEFIWNVKNELEHKKESVLYIMKNIAILAGQDPGEYVNKWFDLVDSLAVAYSDELVVGFAVSKYIGERTVFFPVTMVTPRFQFAGLGRVMNFYLLRHFFITACVRGKKLWPKLYVAFRTQNPVLYSTWMKHLTLFPRIDGSIPEDEAIQARTIVEKIWPKTNFNSSTFVIKDAYLNAPGLRIGQDNIPLSNNQSVNALFENKLRLSKGSSDALLILGKIHSFSQYLKLTFGGSII